MICYYRKSNLPEGWAFNIAFNLFFIIFLTPRENKKISVYILNRIHKMSLVGRNNCLQAMLQEPGVQHYLYLKLWYNVKITIQKPSSSEHTIFCSPYTMVDMLLSFDRGLCSANQNPTQTWQFSSEIAFKQPVSFQQIRKQLMDNARRFPV